MRTLVPWTKRIRDGKWGRWDGIPAPVSLATTGCQKLRLFVKDGWSRPGVGKDVEVSGRPRRTETWDLSIVGLQSVLRLVVID